MKQPLKLKLLILSVILGLSTFAQTPTFRFSYDLGAFDITGGMVQTPAREFVIAGLNNSFGPYYGDALKIDTAGNVIWSKAYTAGFATNFTDIKNVSTGGYIITGSSTSGGGGALLVRIDATGAVIWAFRYQLPNIASGNASNEYGNAVIETSDGGFLVGGGVDYFWDGVSATTVDTSSAMGFKVNSSGALQWSKVWTIATANPDEHYINDVAESADGYFFVGQSSEGSGTLNSNGDYPSNSLIVKTTTAGALTYIRRWGAGNTTSQGINAALTLSTGNILLGGFDDVHAFLVSVSGVGSVTPSVIFNRRLNGSAFGSNYLIQDIMENSDGNYSMIGTQITIFPTAFNTMIGKINSSTSAWIFGRTYAPIGLSAILPEGGLCSDQGYYVSMTDQQAGGFNFNVIRTNSVGQTNDPASGCPGTALTPTLGSETVTFSTPTSLNYDLMTSSAFVPTVTNLPPTRLTHCYNAPAGLSSTAASTNVSCNGTCTGSATVTPSGGTSPYTYTWSPSGGNAATASGLCPNTYTCTIKDNAGATTTQTFTITQPSPLTSTPTQGTISCNGGTTSATVTASGGTGGYTYSWAPSGGTAATASGLSAGNYTATITDSKNCVATNTFAINQPPSITLTVTSSPASCTGTNGSATVTANGGTGSYTYTWTPSGGNAATASGLSTGNYTITVNDANSCAKTATVTISPATGPTVTAVQTSSVTCNGSANGTASVSISGGTPTYSVNWSGGGSGTTTGGLAAGIYTATVTDANSCVATSTVTINEPAPIAITFTNNTSSACVGNTGSVTANASGGTGALTYTWSTGSSGQTLSNVGAGNYTVTVTDVNGCSQQSSANISTVNGPTVTPVVTATVSCNGGSNGTASVSISGGTPSYTVNWSGGAGSGTSVTGLAANIYVITVTDAANCVSTETVSIAGPPALTLTANGSPTGCAAPIGTATASATGGTGTLTYAWSDTQTGATANGLGQNTYTVVVTDANGCKDSTSVSIGVTASPTVSITGSSPSGCASSVGTATANATGGTGAITYTWSDAQTGATASGLGQNTYTVVSTDANGCKDSTTVTIGVTPGPTVSITGSTPTGCTNSIGTATANATGGTGAITYTWSDLQTGATASGLGQNTYTVVASDANGCKDSTTVSIVATGGPTVTVSGTPTGCTNMIGTATASVTGGTGTITYTWSNSQTGASVSGLGQNTYTVVAMDANGCKDSSTVSIGVTANPTVTASSSPTGCTNSVGTATATASGGTGIITYTWSNAQSGATATGLGQNTYTVVSTDANGCKDSTTVSIGVTANPTVTASGSPTGCTNSVGTATASANGGTGTISYTWSNAQSGATAIGLGQNTYTVVSTDANGCKDSTTVTIGVTPNPTVTIDSTHAVKCNGQANGAAYASVTGGTPGYGMTWSNGVSGIAATNLANGTYTIVVTDANGCKDSTTANISEPGVLTVSVTSVQDENCNKANGSATATANGGTSAYTYTWSSGQTSATVTNFSAGTYTVIATDMNGCTAFDTAHIGNIAGPTATLTAHTDATCFGSSNGTATVTASGGTPTYSYTWSNGASGASTGSLAAGNYTATVTDGAGCTYAVPVSIAQPNAIVVSVSTIPAGCNGGNNGSAIATPTGGTLPYTTITWSNAQTGTTATGLTAGIYTVTVTDANTCTGDTVAIITENPPTDSSMITGAICLNDPNVMLNAPSTSGISNYQWSLSGSPITGATNSSYNGSASGYSNYSVMWTYGGCRYVTTSVFVTVSQDLGDLPQTNIFTPNDDKLNDEFIPFAMDAITGTSASGLNSLLTSTFEDYELSIYDRWGILLFKTTTVTEGWTGKSTNGNDMTAGTYYWFAKYKAKCSKNTGVRNIKGFVQLIR